MSPANLFRALADETRLFMLAMIRQHGELCVCDLENILDITQSKASRHLRYLLNAGLIADRRESVWIYYRIADRLTSPQLAILDNAITLLDRRQILAYNRRLGEWRQQKQCGLLREPATSRTVKREVHA